MSSAIVVGSGPNGLAAALTLADAGLSVRVIESAAVLGGGVRSDELTLPGLLHDNCSAMHPLVPTSPFVKRFDLVGAGLEWGLAPVDLAHPLSGGEGAVLQRSITATAAALGSLGGRWRRLFGPFADDFESISSMIMRPQMALPSDPLKLARFGAVAALPATVLARALGSAEARALFLGVAAHAFRPLQSPGSSAVGVALVSAAHANGWPVAIGGSAAIANAIIARSMERGVQFETGRRVRSIRELGRDVNIVMLDTSAVAAAEMIGDQLPSGVRRAYKRFRHGPAAFKVDFAIESGVPWIHEESRDAATVHVGGSIREMLASESATSAGRIPERLFVLVGQQYIADPTRSKGNLHPLWTYAHVPNGFKGDLTETIIQRIEEFAPGFRDRIQATFTRDTKRLAVHNVNYVGGDITTGRNDLWQLLARPRFSSNPYFTGVKGIYLCSAATPPGAGAHGMSGYNAARRALSELE